MVYSVAAGARIADFSLIFQGKTPATNVATVFRTGAIRVVGIPLEALCTPFLARAHAGWNAYTHRSSPWTAL